MDADNERVRKDDPLRSLFQDSGHLSAPADLEAKVFQRLSGPVLVLQPEPPLIGLNGWLSIAALLVALVVAGMQWSTPNEGTSLVPDFTSLLRVPELANALNSRWTISAIAVMLALTLMDRLLVGRVRTFFAL